MSFLILGLSQDEKTRFQMSGIFHFQKLGEPMLLIRGKTANSVFLQHMSTPRRTSGQRRGRLSKRLRCQYHSWSYDITDGSLVAVPDEHDFVDLDRTQRCLPKISCETFEVLSL